MVAIASHMQFPSQGSGYHKHRNESYVCHLTDQHESGGETGSTSLNNPQVLSQDRPKEPTPQTCSTQCAVDHEVLKQTEISFMPHAVLGYSTSIRSSTSIETDLLCADVSFAEDMLGRGHALT